jgi:anti-sigma-K factor RskA
MRHSAATDETREQAALYALGALSQHEARSFEVHIREGCPVCEADLRGFDNVVGALGLGPPQTSPPTYLRDLLVARIAKEGQPSFSPSEYGSAQGPRFESGRRSMLAAVLPWAIAASLAVVAAASLYAWNRADDRSRSQESRIADLILRNEQTREKLEETSSKNDERARMMKALETPGSRMIHLADPQVKTAYNGMLVWDTAHSQWIVSADLPSAPAGKVYQLWFVTQTAKKSAGLMSGGRDGHWFTVADIPSGLDQISAAAITLEPEGGSEQPTMPIYSMGTT